MRLQIQLFVFRKLSPLVHHYIWYIWNALCPFERAVFK